MLVRECMTKEPVTVSPKEDVRVAFSLLRQYGFRQLPVVKDGALVGIVTDRDLRNAINIDDNLVVADVMSSNPVTVYEDTSLGEAAWIIRSHKFNALPVVSKTGKLVGIITVTDILDGLLRLLGFHGKLGRVEVKIPEGTDFFEVLKVIRMASDKVLSFSFPSGKQDRCYLWVVGCDFDKLDKKLEEKELDVEITFSEP